MFQKPREVNISRRMEQSTSLRSWCLVAQSSLTFATPWTVALQASLSMGFSRQECWSGLPCPSPGDHFPTQESNSGLVHCRWVLYSLSHQGSPNPPPLMVLIRQGWRRPHTGCRFSNVISLMTVVKTCFLEWWGKKYKWGWSKRAWEWRENWRILQ